MTKADLRTGMVVTFRSGDKYLVVTEYEKGTLVALATNQTFMPFNRYTDDLKCNSGLSSDRDFDIMSVEDIRFPADIKRVFTRIDDVKLNHIWTREPEEFKVVCVEHLRNEHNFTIGKIYTWRDNTLVNDNGFEFNQYMVGGTDPDKWLLSNGYKFVKVVE